MTPSTGQRSKPRAAVLAIGTELTTGQIINRNASWISERLSALGVEVVLHEVVADDRNSILTALDHCTSVAPWIFITGGLGPTSDDFTRNILAEWANLPLDFHEPSWEAIIRRLQLLGIPVAESNRNQCLFPRGAQILPNPEGTAPGFSFSHSKSGIQTHFWVLPGPPSEVAAIWNQQVNAILRELNPNLKPTRLYTWQCMGKSEAELGELTEHTLQGSELQTGYRAHRPFVEIKVWCDPDEALEKNIWIEKLHQALAPWTITTNGDDLAERLIRSLKGFDSIDVIDQATGGLLAQRLGGYLNKPIHLNPAQHWVILTEWKATIHPESQTRELLGDGDPDALSMVITGFSTQGEAAVGLRSGNQTFSTIIPSPYLYPKQLERTRTYVLEMALKVWSEWLLIILSH